MPFIVTPQDSVPTGGESNWLTASDGTRIRVARFGSATAKNGTVVLLTGRTEFIEKYFEVIGDLISRDYAVATLDWRGQGLSDRAIENRHKGHVKDFDLFVSDLHQTIEEIIIPNCPAPFRALCHSMGGNIGLRYLGEHPGFFSSALFSAPMWGIGTSARTPAWMRVLGHVTHVLGMGDGYIPGAGDYSDSDRAFEGNTLTHDEGRFARFGAQIVQESKLELGGPTLQWARQAIKSMDVLHAEGFAEGIRIPIVVCSAGADTLVSVKAQTLVADRLPMGRQVVVAESKHELMMELDVHRDVLFAAFDELAEGS
jgi:lysophospholipase